MYCTNSDISSYESDCSVDVFIPLHLIPLSPASEPSAFGKSTESFASGSFKSATSAPNLFDASQPSVFISLECEILETDSAILSKSHSVRCIILLLAVILLSFPITKT